MIYKLFLLYIFLSQFPAVIKIGTSSVGFQIFLLPVFYLISPSIKKCLNFVFPFLFISICIVFLNHGSPDVLEIILRLVGVFTLITSLTLPFFIYKKSKNFFDFKNKFLKLILFLSIPNLIFCISEILAKYFQIPGLTGLLSSIKENIFVPGRGVHTIGTISGLFPEHGLYPPFLFFIAGIALLFFDTRKLNNIFLISALWILSLLLHSSGLFFLGLIISISTFLLSNLLSICFKFIISKVFIRYILILSFTGIILFFLIPFYNKFIIERLFILINNFQALGFAVDESLYFKLLPYYLLFKLSLFEILFGSGLGNFGNAVIEKIDVLPELLIQTRPFTSQIGNRFALNATIICAFIEYGLFLFTTLIFILRKNIKFFKPIHLILNYSNVLKTNLKVKEIISVFLFFSSFVTIFGAVPLTYPFPYLSLSLLFIIFDSSNKHKRLN